MRPGRLLTTLASALLLVAASCGQGDSTTEAADGPQSFDDIEFESPIADFLGEDFNFDFSSDEAEAEFAAEQQAVEQKIATCMREQGFEYTPMDQSQFTMFAEDDQELPYFSDAWVDKYGFGITTQMFPQSEVGPDLVGFDDEAFDEPDEIEDPNQAYVETLPAGEQAAYYAALWGAEPELPDDATEEEMEAAYSNFEPSGCQAEAYGEGFFGGDDSFYEEFGSDLEDLEKRVEADPRVAEFRSEVSACLADKGLEFDGDMESLYEQYEEKMSGIGPDWSGDPFEEAGLDPEQMTEDEIDDFFSSQETLDDDDRVALGELQAEEIELAKATIDCGGGPLNEIDQLGKIRVEYEEEFLAENADRLAPFKDSASDE